MDPLQGSIYVYIESTPGATAFEEVGGVENQLPATVSRCLAAYRVDIIVEERLVREKT